MQIKRFEAKNMTTALRMIKGELGPEAIILSARSLRKGKGFFGSMKYAGVEVTAAIDTRENQTKTGKLSAPEATDSIYLSSPPKADSQVPERDRKSFTAYSNYGRAYQKKYRPNNKVDSINHRAFSFLYQQMLAQGVDRQTASEIIDEVKRIPVAQSLTTNSDLIPHLKSILEDMGVRADGNAFVNDKPHIVSLIGTTGAGKTTTIAKLAAMQTHRHKQRVAVISIDHYGIAANEQLKRYARIIGIPLTTAVNSVELKLAIKKHKQQDLIFIDTPGLNPNNQIQIQELKAYFSKLPDLQIHFVVSVATKEKDLREISQTFREVGVQRLLFTKIDESKTYGNMLNALIQIKKLDRNLFDQPSKPKTNRSAEVPESNIGSPHFVANKKSDIYHNTDCKWSDKIKPGNMIQFTSTREAEARNFLPCRSCNPDRPISDRNPDLGTDAQKVTSYH
jgi:flagellar biosynthesis protein FlhF